MTDSEYKQVEKMLSNYPNLKIKVENALSRLNEEERKRIECRYFIGLSINRSCEVLDITPATFNRKRKKIIENTLIPLL